jgi:hypothetical protein
VRAASAALLAAAMFFAGVLVGGRGVAGEPAPPTPVALVAARPGSPEPTPSESPLHVEEVPREIDEGSIEDYGDDQYGDDSSGPGSGDETDDDNSGSGSSNSGPGSDDSGSGSGSSGSGSSGSGSGSSGPG